MLIDAARGGSPWPVSAHAPLDCYVAGPSVAAPIDVATVRGGFVNAAASVLRRVLGIAAPATLAFQAAPPLLFFSSPPAGLPKALWKACGKDENETRAHFERIQRLGCSDAERERILERYPNVHKIVLNEGYGFEEKTVLAHVDKNPQPAERFEVFADLVDATLRGSQGFDDLQM
ncbi:MAG: hypothetical protein FJX76_11175, partial [Armatimonadetes bacterium]|nr:hypothetical protein [Armatimonadota bacterium]